jgi:EmrB/QacA subfamily drug resistance transporter
MTQTPSAAANSAGRPTFAPAPRSSWLALAVLLAGFFMALVDATIVNVALPSIRNSLNASESTLSWIISGYALTFGLALIPSGRLGDRFGHKWVYIIGVVLFTAASAYCGIAANDFDIIIGRVLQGLAGGIFVPAVGSFIQLLFNGKERGKAFAIMGSVIGISSAVGQIAGGLLIQAFGEAEGWRWVFFVNLPIGILTAIFAIRLLPAGDAHADRSNRMDWLGVILLSAGLVAILVPLIQGQQDGWHAWTWWTMAAGVGGLGLFAAWQVIFTKRGGSALVPPRLFHHLSFTFGTILALVYFAGFTSIFFTLSLLWQGGFAHTALESGFLTLPFAVGTAIFSSQSSKWAAKLGRSVLVYGAALVAIGLGITWFLLANVGASDLNNWILLPGIFIAGAGNGFFLAPNVQFIVATVENSEAGAASGVVQTAQRVGSAIGVAIIGSILFGTLNFGQGKPTPQIIANTFKDGAANAMLMSAVLAVAAFLLVFALPKRIQLHGAPSAAPAGE